MITRVQVKNFRSLADVDVKLGPLTVLVGRNGTGKSTFLDVFRFVRDALRHGLEDAVVARHGIASLRRWAPRKPYNVDVTLTVETHNFWGEYCFTIVSGRGGEFSVGRERGCVGTPAQREEECFEIKNGEWLRMPEAKSSWRGYTRKRAVVTNDLALRNVSALFSQGFYRLRQLLSGSFYNIIPNILREPQKPSSERLLTDHGENFASIARSLQRKGNRFSQLLTSLGKVVEGVNDLRVRDVGGYLVTELKHDELGETRLGNKAPWFELAQESDGTLRMLGMLVSLYQTKLGERRLLALEEPENALHPGALGVLSDVLREATRRHQILVTTQSPDLISRFNVEELRVVERLGGVTQIGPVDERQRESIREQLFSAGDLLRLEGLRREPLNGAGGARA